MAATEPSAEVELDVFSGRTNPSWRLGQDQAKALMREISALPPASGQTSRIPGLGFRGFVVTFRGSWSSVFRVFHTDVSDGHAVRLDSGRRVESLLQSSAPPDVLAEFGRDMGK